MKQLYLRLAGCFPGRLVDGLNLEVELAKPRMENHFKAVQQPQFPPPFPGSMGPVSQEYSTQFIQTSNWSFILLCVNTYLARSAV